MAAQALTVIGIDPGSQCLGWGVVREVSGVLSLVDCGTLRPKGEAFSERLAALFAGLSSLVAEHRPGEAAVEDVFTHKNMLSALKLGQARGVAIAACAAHGVPLAGWDSDDRGVVHVMGPELGLTQPGMTVVCGDSHTATHGAFAALAHGIGTSEVEHVMATQTLVQKKSKAMLIKVEGQLGAGVTAKDVALAIIGKIGTAGGTGYCVEFAGSAIRGLSMEGRMTVCNLAIEAGARAGIIAADETTIAYLEGRTHAPKGAQWEQAVAYWKTLHSDADAVFDTVIEMKAEDIEPQVTWGTSPEQVLAVGGKVPNPANEADPIKRAGVERALQYMGLKADMPLTDITIDKVFIGSCTNSRIEDLRAAAVVAKGKKVASNVKLAIVVPGSGIVKRQAESEGLDKIFTEAGFEWREPGCSMCLAMNADRLSSGERCASTSNRNFEGRQGPGGRTHLVSPVMAAAAAIAGHFVDIRKA